MAIRSSLNTRYIADIVWDLRMTLNELNQRAKLSNGYIYRFISEDGAPNTNAERVQIGTIDAIATALRDRMVELGKDVPANLWGQLLIQEEVEVTELPKVHAPGASAAKLLRQQVEQARIFA